MKINLLLFFSLSFTTIFAQNTNFLEIAVDDMIELAPESAQIEIQLMSASEQIRKKFDPDDFYEEIYDEYEYYESEEDWIYEEMLDESPKKITKEMKEAYEERQKIRYERELEKEEVVKQRTQELEEFEPIVLADIQSKLDELGIKYRKIENREKSIYFDYDSYDDWDESSDYADSSLEVVLTSSEDWSRLTEGMKDMPTKVNVIDVEYGSMDDKINEMIPKLTEKAKKQAQTMANSINRKLGKVIECTNVYPYTPSMKYMASYTNQLRAFTGPKNNSNPFESTKDEMIQYVYRFSLLN